jgi:uncharacterized protein
VRLWQKKFPHFRRPDLGQFCSLRGRQNPRNSKLFSQRQLIPAEVKSAATFSPHYLKGIELFRHVAGDRCQPGHIVYNGEKNLTLRGTQIANPFQTGKFL